MTEIMRPCAEIEISSEIFACAAIICIIALAYAPIYHVRQIHDPIYKIYVK